MARGAVDETMSVTLERDNAEKELSSLRVEFDEMKTVLASPILSFAKRLISRNLRRMRACFPICSELIGACLHSSLRFA